MSAQPRKTYDTDVITFRRMFANDPVTNNYISAGLVLITGEYGSASFQDILTISSISQISTIANTGAVSGICSLSTVVTVGLSTLSTLFGSNGTFYYSTTNYFYESISTVYADGTNIFYDVQNVFLNVPYLSSYTLSTGLVSLSSLNFRDTSTFSTQYLTVREGQLLLNGSTITGDVSKGNLVSTVVGLGTAGYISTSQLVSTTSGLLESLGGGVTDFQIASTLQYSPVFSSVAVGYSAGVTSQGINSVAIGNTAGSLNQGTIAVAIGNGAGTINQGGASIAIGNTAGYTTQDVNAIAIGIAAGYTTQGDSSISIGNAAGHTTQGTLAVAVGPIAGNLNQGQRALAIGYNAGANNQGSNSIAIGPKAGETNLPVSTIVLSALLNTPLNPPNAGFFVSPVRNIEGIQTHTLGYNSNTYEIGLINNAPGDTVNVANLVSTVGGLGTAGYISSLSTINLSTQNLFTSTVTFKDINTGANQILAVSSGTLILNGQGITGGGGGVGDVTTAQLISTVENLAQLGYVSSSQLVSSLSSWALYPAISSIQLNSNQPYIINPNINAAAIIQTGSLLIQDEFANPGGVNLNFVTFTTSTSQDSYTLLNDVIASGSVSSFSLIHGTVNEMGSLYLSSIYFGNLGGSVYGQLTTDSTASDIYWNGSSLTQGGSGGGITTAQLVSTVINFQTDFRTRQISTGFVQTSSVNLLDTYTSAQNFLTVSSGTLLLNGAAITGSGGGAVSQIVAGSNINITPVGGTGSVTINNSINPTGLVSTANLIGLVSTANLIGLVSTANLIGLVSTANLSGLVSTTFFTNQVVSTVIGLGTAGYVSTASLTSTITAIGVFLSTISTAYATYFYTNIGLISSLTVSSLTFGTGDGFLAMPDIRPMSMSTLVTQTSSLQTFSLLIGATSTVTAIQYFGLQGNFNNTVLAERSISTGVQEFLIFKGSSPADQIRFQTTGIFEIETGVSGRLWSTVTQVSVPAFLIDINSNVGIRTSSPGATLDVAGSIRGQSLSTQQIQFSTLFGGYAQEQINSSIQITASSIYATLAGPITFVLLEA